MPPATERSPRVAGQAPTQMSLFDAPFEGSFETPSDAPTADARATASAVPAAPYPAEYAGASPGQGSRSRPVMPRTQVGGPTPSVSPGGAASPQRHQQAPWRHPQAEHSVMLAGQSVAYALRRARRRSIGFSVGPDGLAVAAPRWVGVGDIEAALTAKARWIVGKLQEQAERSRRLDATRIQWGEGATLPFLGQPLVLLLDPRVSGVMLDAAGSGGQFVIQGVAHTCLRVGLPQTAAPVQIRDAVQGWLQRQALRLFTERTAHFAAILKVRVKALKLSSAQTRWGSASADGTIRLNWRLVHFALPTIDYVVAHELAHLRHMDHSPRFWDVVRSVVADVDGARGTLRNELLPPLD